MPTMELVSERVLAPCLRCKEKGIEAHVLYKLYEFIPIQTFKTKRKRKVICQCMHCNWLYDQRYFGLARSYKKKNLPKKIAKQEKAHV